MRSTWCGGPEQRRRTRGSTASQASKRAEACEESREWIQPHTVQPMRAMGADQPTHPTRGSSGRASGRSNPTKWKGGCGWWWPPLHLLETARTKTSISKRRLMALMCQSFHRSVGLSNILPPLTSHRQHIFEHHGQVRFPVFPFSHLWLVFTRSNYMSSHTKNCSYSWYLCYLCSSIDFILDLDKGMSRTSAAGIKSTRNSSPLNRCCSGPILLCKCETFLNATLCCNRWSNFKLSGDKLEHTRKFCGRQSHVHYDSCIPLFSTYTISIQIWFISWENSWRLWF